MAELYGPVPSFVSTGDAAIAYVNPTLFLGTVAEPVATVIIGNGSTAVTPVAKQISFTNASGVDNAAGNATIVAPLSTGAATPADLAIQVGTTGASSAVLQTATTLILVHGVDQSVNIGPHSTNLPTYGEASADGLRVEGRLKIYRTPSGATVRTIAIGGSFAVPVAVANGVNMGVWDNAGWNGAAVVQGVTMLAITTEGWAVGATGTKFQINTTPTGSTGTIAALTITENQGLLINNPRNNTSPFVLSGYSLTAANAQTMFDLSGTWNTSGVPVAFKLAITNTAVGAGALLMNLLAGAGGVTSMFSVDTAGVVSCVQVSATSTITAGSSGQLAFSGRARFASPVTTQMNLTDNTSLLGVGFDFATDAVLKLRVRAQNADATMSSLQHWFTGAATAPAAGQLAIGGTQQTTIGANGAASALTANPLGYIVGKIGATAIIIPYYNA